MGSTRSPAVTLYLGANQFGKSRLMRRHQDHWARQNPDSPIFRIGKKGQWVIGADEDSKLLYPIIRSITNNGMGPTPKGPNPMVGMEGALIEFDDGDSFIPIPIKGTPYHTLFLENAHCRLDVQVTAHRPETLDKNLLGAAHHIYLFYMGESYAVKYLRSLEGLQDSDVLRLKQFPKKRGQFIHVRQDPSRTHPAQATFHDEYDPALDQNQGAA